MSDPQPLLRLSPAAWLANGGDGSTWVGNEEIHGRRGSFTPWHSDREQAAAADDDEPVEPEVAPEMDAPARDAASFAEGFAEGQRSVRLELAAERAALVQLTQSLEALRPEPTNALAALLAATVERLVRQIVGNVEVDAALLVARAERAAALIGEEVEPAKLLVHPDDLALLAGANIAVKLVGDPALARGSVRLECGSGWIEDGPAVRLERLKAALDRLGAPE